MKYSGKIDPQCVKLCDALNKLPGVHTAESCCGHGERPYHIWFKVDDLDALPMVCFHFDG